MIQKPPNPLEHALYRSAELGLPPWFMQQGKGKLSQAAAEIAQLMTGRDWALIGFAENSNAFYPAFAGEVSAKLASACQILLAQSRGRAINLANADTAIREVVKDLGDTVLPKALAILPLTFHGHILFYLALGSNTSADPLSLEAMDKLDQLCTIINEINNLRGEMRFLALDLLDLVKSNIDLNSDPLA